MQALVSGLFTSAFALGNFCGPTLSGLLFDSIGFGYNCLVLQILAVLMCCLNLASFLLTPSTKPPGLPDVVSHVSYSSI